MAQAHVTRRRQPRTLRAKRVAMPSNNQSQRRQKAGKSAAVAERKPAASAEAGPKQAAKQGTPSAQPPKKEKGKKKKAKKAKEPEPEPTPVEPSAYSVLVAKKLRNSTKRLVSTLAWVCLQPRFAARLWLWLLAVHSNARPGLGCAWRQAPRYDAGRVAAVLTQHACFLHMPRLAE